MKGVQGNQAAQVRMFAHDAREVQLVKGAASVATGIIEGGVTRYIGSANNTFKFLNDIKGQGQINIYNLFNKPSLNAWGSFAIEGGKRIGGELAEENLIYGGTQV